MWFTIRKSAKVTGGCINTCTAMGMETLKKQQNYFDHKIFGKVLEQHSQTVKTNMKHGMENEINAVATILGKVMPYFFQTCIFKKKDVIFSITIVNV